MLGPFKITDISIARVFDCQIDPNKDSEGWLIWNLRKNDILHILDDVWIGTT